MCKELVFIFDPMAWRKESKINLKETVGIFLPRAFFASLKIAETREEKAPKKEHER